MNVTDSRSPQPSGKRCETHPIPLEFQSQLEELKLLRHGWLDGKGLAPPSDGLDWLSKVFTAHYPDNLSQAYLYPVTEGGVRLEWSLGPRDVSLEVDLMKRSGEWHCLNLETDEDEATTLRMETEDDWNWIVGRLQILSGRRP
jgi:hypothetical protein